MPDSREATHVHQSREDLQAGHHRRCDTPHVDVAGSRALAQDEGRFDGIVVDDRTMQPVQGAVVSVSGQDGTEVTSADGSFSFGVLPVGVVHLRVQREGYSSTVEQVEVVPGGGTFLQLSIAQITAVLDEVLVRVRSRRSRADLDAVGPSDSDSGATAADLLAYRLPGVRVDRGTGALGGESRSGFEESAASLGLESHRSSWMGRG